MRSMNYASVCVQAGVWRGKIGPLDDTGTLERDLNVLRPHSSWLTIRLNRVLPLYTECPVYSKMGKCTILVYPLQSLVKDSRVDLRSRVASSGCFGGMWGKVRSFAASTRGKCSTGCWKCQQVSFRSFRFQRRAAGGPVVGGILL